MGLERAELLCEPAVRIRGKSSECDPESAGAENGKRKLRKRKLGHSHGKGQ